MKARCTLTLAAFILVLIFEMGFASFARAQLSLPGMTSDLSITADPSDPAPGQPVTLTAHSALLDLSNASITWSADGTTIAQGIGETTAQVTTGASGSPTNVTVSVSGAAGSASTQISLTPETVDLLFDANSYVPPFYRGRALPSPGSSLRVQAIPHIITPSGTASADSLIYTWRQDGEVLGSMSGQGRSTATLPAPPLFGASTVSVEARTPDGAYAASASVTIPAVDPGITLYQDHPLFGIEYYDALAGQQNAAELEETLAAVPYFVEAASPDDPRLSYAWQVNGTPISAATSSQSEITLNAAGATGPAALSLDITSPYDYYLDARGSWTITFGASSGSSPFSPALGGQSPPSDAFHPTQ